MKYKAQEREWVRRILARLTPEQRERYEEACMTAPRHRNGKLYDEARAAIAERIMYEDRITECDYCGKYHPPGRCLKP
jgi:hypothetical protein